MLIDADQFRLIITAMVWHLQSAYCVEKHVMELIKINIHRRKAQYRNATSE